MRKEEFNDRQLKELENELRGFGTPYSAEPDSRYWANFRVNVMERIREEEARKATPWYETALGWIEEHVLVTSLSTAVVLVAVWASLMMQPLGETPQIAFAPKVEQPVQQLQPKPVVQQSNVAAIEPAKPAVEKPQHQAVTHINDNIEQLPDMAMLDVPVADEVGPASLDDLSSTELQSVLSILETE